MYKTWRWLFFLELSICLSQHTPIHRLTSTETMPPKYRAVIMFVSSINTEALQPADLLLSLQSTAHNLRQGKEPALFSPSFINIKLLIVCFSLYLYACIHSVYMQFLRWLPLCTYSYHITALYFPSRKATTRRQTSFNCVGTLRALSIHTGTSKPTARRCTIRVHGWDGNHYKYTLLKTMTRLL